MEYTVGVNVATERDVIRLIAVAEAMAKHTASEGGSLPLNLPTFENVLPKRIELLIDAVRRGQLKVCDCDGKDADAQQLIQASPLAAAYQIKGTDSGDILALYARKYRLIEWGNANDHIFHIVDMPGQMVESDGINRGYVGGGEPSFYQTIPRTTTDTKSKQTPEAAPKVTAGSINKVPHHGGDMKHESLLGLIEPYADGPFAKLPDDLRQRVIEAFDTQSAAFDAQQWDALTPDGLRSLASQYDQDNKLKSKYWRALQGEIWHVELAITAWKEKNDGGRPSEALIQETKLSALGKRLDNLNKLYGLPPFLVEDPKALTDDALARLVADGAKAPAAKIVGPSGDGTTAIDAASTQAATAQFLAMKKLLATELSLVFVGDKAESGLAASNMLEVSARNVTKRVALAELGLSDRRSGTASRLGGILLGMAKGEKLFRTEKSAATMRRLRYALRQNLGISGDPFDRYRKETGWVPLFKIEDRRGAADDRAKRDAERRTDSLEQLTGRGYQLSGQENQIYDDENDATDKWLKDNDPDA